MNEKVCKDCSNKFQFPHRRGRKPERCPTCRERVKNNWRKSKEKNKEGNN